MSNQNMSEAELRQALAAADRGIRLPYAVIIVGGAVSALFVSIMLRFADWANSTHVVVAAATAFLWCQMFISLSLVTARQNAANARMLRALELVEAEIARR